MDTESHLIRRIARRVPSSRFSHFSSGVKIGIGDDAAVIQPGRGKELVVTCDTSFEGVHFFPDRHPPESVGYKSLARATSDIAAMGATPRWFVLAIALPAHKTGVWLDRFSTGMARAARDLNLILIGGDTTRTKSISSAITVIGEIEPSRAILRAGAQPGDSIHVSGRLGEARLGLEWVRRGIPIPRRLPSALRQHLYPHIPVDLGQWLARNRIPSAMMDISDGLSTDLARLCEISGVGARIEANSVPRVEINGSLPRALRRARLDPLAMALHGGDDYVLLFTVPPQKAAALRRAPGFGNLACIGEITREKKLVLVNADGKAEPLQPGGWDPFRLR